MGTHTLLDFCKQMEEEKLHLASHTLVSLLKASASLKNRDKGQLIHAEIVRNGCEGDLFVGSSLVDMYIKCGALLDAQDVFQKLPARDVVSWNVMISACAELERGKEALKYFEQMQLDGILPNRISLACSLKACGMTGDKEKGKDLHLKATKIGLENNSFVASSLVFMYTKCGSFLDADDVLKQMLEPNVVAWNALLHGLAESGCFVELRERFKRMQIQNISPDSLTYMCTLKACTDHTFFDMGLDLHMNIVLRGIENDDFVRCTLVDMYAKCSHFTEAWCIFEQIEERDAVPWNVFISEYGEQGFGGEAISCFFRMQVDGIVPNTTTFVSTLKACANLRDMSSGRVVHMDIVKKAMENDPSIINILVDMYAKCCSLLEAQETFDKGGVPNIVSWNTLVAGYVEHEYDEKALECYNLMKLERVAYDLVTLSCLLRAYANLGSLNRGREMHTELIQRGWEKEMLMGNVLVDMYARCGSMEEGQKMLNSLAARNVTAFNSLIAGYLEHGHDKEALLCYEQMQLQGLSLSMVTLLFVLKACGSIKAADTCLEVHMILLKNGYDTELFIASTLVGTYAKCGLLFEASRLFKSLHVRDVVCWNALITAYVEHGSAEEALNCVEQMCSQHVSQDCVTFIGALKACGTIEALDKGRGIHMEILKKELEKDSYVISMLVDMYMKCGHLEEARTTFKFSSNQSVVSWNALISGYSEYECHQKALECYEEMHAQRISGNVITFASVLKSCGGICMIDKGQEMHMLTTVTGLEEDVLAGNSLVDMYVKCGLILDAYDVFQTLPARNCVIYNTIIQGFTLVDQVNMALELFDFMIEEGVKPDNVTFSCLLGACSQANLVLKGQKLFGLMMDKHNVEHYVDHFTCMIDLLARSGGVTEAEKLLGSMPCPPSQEACMALLSACKMYEETTMGLRCFQRFETPWKTLTTMS